MKSVPEVDVVHQRRGVTITCPPPMVYLGKYARRFMTECVGRLVKEKKQRVLPVKLANDYWLLA